MDIPKDQEEDLKHEHYLMSLSINSL